MKNEMEEYTMVKVITDNNLQEAKKEELAVLDFSAVWCGPCSMLAPVLEGLAEEMSGDVAFYNIDVDKNPQLAAEYQIMNIPALVLLKNGEKAGMTVGFQPKESLKKFIEDHRG